MISDFLASTACTAVTPHRQGSSSQTERAQARVDAGLPPAPSARDRQGVGENRVFMTLPRALLRTKVSRSSFLHQVGHAQSGGASIVIAWLVTTLGFGTMSSPGSRIAPCELEP